jgi:outer membrane protein assembly factor BamB
MFRRLALGLLILLAACDDGGGGSSNPIPNVPALPWGNFRHDASNSGLGNGVGLNGGNPSLIVLEPAPIIPTSTVTVDLSGNIFLGTTGGLFSFTSDGQFRWLVTECPCPIDIPCAYPTPIGGGAPRIPIGPIRSTPTVTAGSAILFGSDPSDDVPGQAGAGAMFAMQDIKPGARPGSQPGCYWGFRPTVYTHDYRVRSSPIALVSALDLSLQSIFFADSDGVLRGLNADGTTRWQIKASDEEITSSPALDFSGNIYITTPDGILTVATINGTPAWTASIGVPPPPPIVDPDRDLLTSLSFGTNAYVIGEGGALFARLPNGQERWTYTPPTSLVGSPALILLTFGVQSFTATDVIIAGIDADTNAYAVRDATGQPYQVQQCSAGNGDNCRMDSCTANGGGVCISNRCTLSGFRGCTTDSCLPNNGICQVIPTFGAQPIAPGQTVSTAPVLSADAFLVFGTDQGYVCAKAINGNAPSGAAWNNPSNPPGCIKLASNNKPVLAAPAIGFNGQIYVSTESGLYIIQ